MALEVNSLPFVIADDHPRPAALGHEAIQLSRDTDAGQRCVRQKGEAFPGAVIHDGEHAEATAAGELTRLSQIA